MPRRAESFALCGFVAAVVFMASAARADTLTDITVPSAQKANDSVNWSQLGTDATILGSSFKATSASGISAGGSFAGASPTSIIAVACPASPCSWGDGTSGSTPFTAGDSLIWTADAGNSGNGPLTITFGKPLSGVGALIQEDAPGQFTAEVQVFNGSGLLGSFTEDSDASGDPLYIGLQDSSGANINRAVFSITSSTNTAGDPTDFAIGRLLLNVSPPAPPAPLVITPTSGKFGAVTVGQPRKVKFRLKNGASTNGPSIKIFGTSLVGSREFQIQIPAKNGCKPGTVLAPASPCFLNVIFRPRAKGKRPGATLMVEDDANNAPQSIPLSGKGK